MSTSICIFFPTCLHFCSLSFKFSQISFTRWYSFVRCVHSNRKGQQLFMSHSTRYNMMHIIVRGWMGGWTHVSDVYVKHEGNLRPIDRPLP